MDDTRPFPIQGDHTRDQKTQRVTHLKPCTVPWWLAELAYQVYSRRYGTSQSLERLAERGGFSRSELLAFLEPAGAASRMRGYG